MGRGGGPARGPGGGPGGAQEKAQEESQEEAQEARIATTLAIWTSGVHKTVQLLHFWLQGKKAQMEITPIGKWKKVPNVIRKPVLAKTIFGGGVL